MNYSKTLRISLIGLLPVIALLVYFEGQQYDPALIRFQSSQSVRDSISAFFPGKIEGFVKKGQVRLYTKENLYEYVNGHAEYFISAGFEGVAVGEYALTGSDSSQPDVVVDIYDMGRSIQAFGVLSDESGGKLTELQDGLEGFRTPLGLSFVRGQYYVKISSYNEEASLDRFTESISSALGAKADPFPEFSRLPDIGDVVATRFIREAYRGLDFVNNVIEREYERGGVSVQVFVKAGDRSEVDRLVGSFTEYFRQEKIQYVVTENQEKKIFRIRDPYEGDWVMIALPDALYGIYGSIDDRLINTF